MCLALLRKCEKIDSCIIIKQTIRAKGKKKKDDPDPTPVHQRGGKVPIANSSRNFENAQKGDALPRFVEGAGNAQRFLL